MVGRGASGEDVKAAVSAGYGPPDVVRIEQVPVPSPRAGQVLVKVHVSTVNRTDCGYRAAHPYSIRAFSGWRRPKRTIPGCRHRGGRGR